MKGVLLLAVALTVIAIFTIHHFRSHGIFLAFPLICLGSLAFYMSGRIAQAHNEIRMIRILRDISSGVRKISNSHGITALADIADSIDKSLAALNAPPKPDKPV